MRFKYTSTAKGEREFILILGKVDWYRKKLDAPYELQAENLDAPCEKQTELPDAPWEKWTELLDAPCE